MRVSPTLINLVEDHGFISEKYYLHCYCSRVLVGMSPTLVEYHE